MPLDRLPDLNPEEGVVLDEELAYSDDVLVKIFALGPRSELDPHAHEGSRNVFHVLEGEVVVVQDDDEERIAAPGVVVHEPGAVHGARNESDERAVLTATFAPSPG
ncbi:MAG: cupin domain-containing protein [Halanaeroarchaeum sp.]